VNKRWVALAAVAGILSLGMLIRLGGGDGADEPSFRLAPINKGGIRATVASTGKLNPLNTVQVGSQVSGIIKEINVDFNSDVRRGQLIALIDPAYYAAQAEQARAQLLIAKAQHRESQKSIAAAEAAVDSALAQCDSAKATLREAELHFKRLQRLDKEDVIARSDMDAADARLENAQGAMAVAQAQVKTAKANLNRSLAQVEGAKALIVQREAALHLAEIQLDYCTISSPIDGVVISRHVDVGQTVAASLQSPVLFTIAEDLSRMQVEVDVSEADVGQIHAGQEVAFTVDAFPEQKFKAEVRQVRNAATSIQNVVTYTIIADVQNDSLSLRPGMTANVIITVAEVSDALKVPNAALRFKPSNESETIRNQNRIPIRERSSFKAAVEKLGLDAGQVDQFEAIVKEAGVKLKEAYALPEDQRDIPMAWKNFYTDINRRLYTILKGEQFEKFAVYINELKEKYEKNRRNKKIRAARIYVLNDAGQPEAVDLFAGVSDDTQTQIFTEELKEGDNVIVGIAFDLTQANKKKSSILSILMGRR